MKLKAAGLVLPMSASLSLAYGALIPNRHYLSDGKEAQQQKSFVVQWLAEHDKDFGPQSFASSEALKKTFANEDDFAQKLAELEYLPSRKDQASNNAILAFTRKAVREHHPLAPYFLAHAQKRDLLGLPEEIVLRDQILSSPNTISYVDFLHISKRLTDRNFVRANIDACKKLLSYLVEFNHNRTIDEIASIFLKILDKSYRPNFRQEFAILAIRRPTLVNRFPWIRNYLKSAEPTAQTLSPFQLALSHTDCPRAKTELERLLLQPTSSTIDLIENVKELKECPRYRGLAKQISLINELTPTFQKERGIEGYAAIKMLAANLYWNQDLNKEATEILEKLAQDENLPQSKIKAQVIYQLARIQDNDQNFDGAAKTYTQFMNEYPTNELLAEVQKWLALVYVRQKNWEMTYKTCRELIDSQGEVSGDLLDLSLMGFALFWGGRAALEIDRKDEGIDLWHRLASEYFSTYYGALAHYALEEISQREMMLAARNPITFDQDFISGAFPNLQKPTITRIQTLLRLGLKQYAAFEINNLRIDPQNATQGFIKALFQHGAGAWLDSIKEYSKLPYSYRTMLPIESERLLFPKKFEIEISAYATKAKMDPFLILSLIRQESVFNPKAMSQAGARGLMQLMEKTALEEARKLSKDYIPQQLKTKIVREIHNSRNLHETETNIILGVHYFKRLFDRYNNPALSLAAYNAGPTAVSRWQQKYPTADILYFVEKIPYKETRNYVKLILRNYFYYKRWYQHDFDQMHFIHLNPIGASLSHLRLPIAPTPLSLQ